MAGYVGQRTFMIPYGDGVTDVDIPRLVKFHRQQTLAPVTAVHPASRLGELSIKDGRVTAYHDMLKALTLIGKPSK